MTITHSSALGWTAGQNISDEFAALAKTLKPGDVFVFDHKYKIDATNITLSDGVTIAGGSSGAGLDVLGTTAHSDPLFIFGNSGAIVDLKITHSDTSGTTAQFNNGATIHMFGNNNRIINSSFEGNPKEFVRVGGDSLSVIDTTFDGSYYQMRWFGAATNFTVENSLFQNSDGDGIKTARDGSGQGTVNATVSNSVFMNNDRDGIDTTNGFKDSLVTDSFFIDNFAALDLKIIFDSSSDGSPGIQNTNITIRNTEMIGWQKTSIVTTLLNRDGTDPAIAESFAPNNITVENSIFENTRLDGGYGRAWYIKDGYNLFDVNNQHLGKLRNRDDQGDPNALTETGLTTGPARAEQPDSYYRGLAGPDWSSISYPTDGTPTPPKSEVEPDPISYEPEDPVAEEPVPDITPVTSPSTLLDIFVAYTDTDETISQLGANSTIDSSLTDGRALTIYAMPSGTGTEIGSVRLVVDGVGSQTESLAPYALFGDNGKGDFGDGKQLSEGSYAAELTVFSGAGGSGEILETVSFDFAVGDTGSTPIVEEPVAEDPVVEEPVTEDPVAEEPVPDITPVTSPSTLLDIFVAYTDTDETISQLGANSTIDSSLTDGRALTIYAMPSGTGTEIGSVRLVVDGVGSQTESLAPYALFGDNGKGDFGDGKQLSEGSYAAELTVFSGAGGSGEILETVSFDFAVGDTGSTPIVEEPVAEDPVAEEPVTEDPVAEVPVAEEPVPETDLVPDLISRAPDSQFLEIQLVDTSTDKALFDLRDGAKLSSSELSGRKVSLSAEAIGSNAVDIGSVKLELDGEFSRVESVEPYALFGDTNGDFLGGTQLTDGSHSLTLTAYSDKGGKGLILEQVTLSFEVGDYESMLVDGSPSTVSSYSAVQDTGTATVSNDQSSIALEGSAWKSLDFFGDITNDTTLAFDFKSDAEGEIHGIGFINKDGDLESVFFQLDGSQELGIQDFNDVYETGSGFKSYTIPVGEFFTGSADQLVLINDDDADLGAVSAFSNISLVEGIA